MEVHVVFMIHIRLMIKCVRVFFPQYLDTLLEMNCALLLANPSCHTRAKTLPNVKLTLPFLSGLLAAYVGASCR